MPRFSYHSESYQHNLWFVIDGYKENWSSSWKYIKKINLHGTEKTPRIAIFLGNAIVFGIWGMEQTAS